MKNIEKGSSSAMTNPIDKKKITGLFNFHTLPTYQILRFLNKCKCNGQTDVRTDGHAQTNMPPQLLRSWEQTTNEPYHEKSCLLCFRRIDKVGI